MSLSFEYDLAGRLEQFDILRKPNDSTRLTSCHAVGLILLT